MTAELKRLSKNDLADFRSMLNLFGDVFDEHDTYKKDQPDDGYVLELLNDASFMAYIAKKNGKTIGAITAYELKKYEQKRSEIYIYDLAVEPSSRRQGVATSLIQAIRDEAKIRAAWVVFIQADQGDEAPIALYSKLGKREEVLHFDIEP